MYLLQQNTYEMKRPFALFGNYEYFHLRITIYLADSSAERTSYNSLESSMNEHLPSSVK